MKISVCIATFNGEKYIKEQLESILSQLGCSDEVIVSDDGSSDNTITIINRMCDPRVRVFFNDKERGYTNNFENALSKATGDYIFLSDQDDVWVENKVSLTVELLKKYDFVVSDNKIVDSQLRQLSPSHFRDFKTRRGFIRNLLFPRYVGACMAFNRSVLEKSLPFPKFSKLCAHDYWICLVSELFFRCYKFDRPLILYRRHSMNVSTGGVKSKNTLLHKLNVRVYTVVNLVIRAFR